MKLSDVISEVSAKTNSAGQSSWFRPASWSGTGQAYTIKEGLVCYVPSSRGGQPGITADPDLLSGNWVLVSADEVLAEHV